MNEVDLAYAAGIFDGEGSVSIIHTKTGHTKADGSIYRHYRLQVCVVNTNPILCQWLKETFGGCITQSHKGENRLPLWQWIKPSHKGAKFLKLIQPYLHLKSPQVKLALEFQDLRKFPMYHFTEEDNLIAEQKRILMHKFNGKRNTPLKAC
jgi:hypothetical protein